MKLKRLAEDFEVEEVSAVRPQHGPFALYRLTKRGLGTPEAVAAVAERFAIPPRDVAFSGLKDRHAVTRQLITIYNGPRRNLRQTNLELAYLGQASRAVAPGDITANRFTITLRDLSPEEQARLEPVLAEAARDGLPNYFDEQRFGSVGQSGEFMAGAWCRGDYGRALWLAVADASSHDRPQDKKTKEFLRTHWEQWAACAEALERTPYHAALAHLVDRPNDLRGAVRELPADRRRLWLAAYQSDLWNRVLAAVLHKACRPEQIIDVPLGQQTVAFFRELDPPQRAGLAAATLPLPSARTRLEEGAVKAVVDRVLRQEGLELRGLKADNLRDSFFSKGDRQVLYRPRGLEHTVAEDEVYPGRSKVTLRCELPRGCYATILVRRLTVG